jgi:hypothetical protein
MVTTVLAVAVLAGTNVLAGGVALAASDATGSGNGAAVAYGVAAATQLAGLPFLEPTVLAGGQSSFDRNTGDASHGNQDLNNFLASGPGGNVMLDQRGPGCVYRIWMTSLEAAFPAEWVKIYFDGSRVPAIDVTMAQMFSGTHAPFLAPLVDNILSSSGGYVSYVPLCYRSSIKIVTNMDRYYNIGYLTYPPGSDVTTWTPAQNTAAMRAEWSHVTADPIGTARNTSASGTLTLAPGATRSLVTLTGPRTIEAIKIAIAGVTASSGATAAAVLDHTWIKINWDGHSAAAVDAPLGSFFALGQFGSSAAHGLVAGLDASNTMYMYLPMPFRRSATIRLVNASAGTVSGISYQIQYRPFTGNFANVGYLRTSYTKTTNAPVGRDIPILHATGSGKFIGVTASYTGDLARSYLEGDERITVDGSDSPAFYGTGAEDFFNGGFYFDHGPYSQPLAGNTVHATNADADQTSAYRFFLQDAIPFRRAITVTIQHGPYDNTTDTSASMLAYYYQRPASQSRLTDALKVGSSVSDRRHRYVITGQRWHGTRSYQYEGTADTINITDSGRGYRGYSQFTLALAPGNQGVDLRRRYDQGIAKQAATVYVDGHRIGTWYVAGRNPYHRWADTDLIIPPALTSHKKSITVKIRYLGGSPYFTEFRYWAYSLMP